jgi:glyceraldehyde-3-phosphate dehydrogenase/erythrose-4-phosphate dehydrogenase
MNEMTIVSNASCITNFLTPLEKLDNEEFGIPKGLMPIVYTTTTTWKK